MASVKVAVRVRPFNQREKDMNAKLIVQMDGKKTRLMTAKNSKEQNDVTREKYKDFTFDHSYWSYDHNDKNYASQEQVFSDLGIDVIDSAFEGYNACVFAYGQTGSGKTFTMMGSPEYQGLIPRICRQLFSRMATGKESGASYRTEVSYLEIYNERVKDLLATDAGHSLRVREHPKLGPYVQDLSKHLVTDYDDIQECMHRGNLHRTTASTQMNDVSSRSHAIFTLTFVQASYLRHNNMPSETVSKVHLVDLAGSERADATGATGQRLVEGAHINKSLVTLGSVISALAESAQLSIESRNKGNKKVFIPYRDSVLTWLLKDSLGGNSKTIMIAAISPADCNYGETLSTLRYANRAKNIINKPTINEDPNVKLIRELREEIEKLRAQISHTTDPVDTEPGVLATLQRKEAQEKVLTEKWTEKWRETQQILQEQKALGLRKSGLGVVLDSDMPHLVGIDDNLLSTGVTLYHLKEGETIIGTEEHNPTPDIVLSGAGVLPLHCTVTLEDGVAFVSPASGAHCWLNTVLIDKPAKLSQGCILLLGRTNMFRYNDPAEAAALRRSGAGLSLSRLSLLSWSSEHLEVPPLEVEGEIRQDRIETQRAELERERQQFLLQQEERQRKWLAEREQLMQAQKELDVEREAMEREYAAACRRLSGEWRALEKGWSQRRGIVRARQRQLHADTRRLRVHVHAATDRASNEEGHAAALRSQIEGKRQELEEFVKSAVRTLVAQGCVLDESTTPSPDSGASESSTECLMHLLMQCEPATAASIRDTVDKHKKELVDLEQELQTRVASVATQRAKVERLQAELTLLSAQETNLQKALSDDNNTDESNLLDGFKRSKSELVLRTTPLEEMEPITDDERERMRARRMSFSLSLDPLACPSTLNTDGTFHTANSCSTPPTAEATPTNETDLSQLTSPSAPPTSQSQTFDSQSNTIESSNMADSQITMADSESSLPAPNFRLGPPDDSDDMSSTEDYHKPRIVEGQSSSSVERSPEERHQRARHRRKLSGDKTNRRQVTEAEALRAMQRLCSRIASQKLLVISSLENDCSKEELNRQIAVLQELQKKYVRLEMALQYSFFDTQNRSPRMMVTPIQETPSLTLSESDVLVSRDVSNGDVSSNNDVIENNNHCLHDPLLHRLKDTETEASDNMSTSNEDVTSQDTWEHPLRRSSADEEHFTNGRVIQLSPPPPDPTLELGLLHPIDFSRVISIPGWVTRGAGASTHHEYEVRVCVGGAGGDAGGRWALLRRYRRFRDLYLAMSAHYGQKVASIPFPNRQLWAGERVARTRRPALEQFLRRLLTVCAADPRCPFHQAPLTRDTLQQFSPFFRKGVFESGKCGTG